MTNTQEQNINTRWGYWAAGLYLTLATIPTMPLESSTYGLMSVLSFLFLWGYLRSDDL